MLVGDRGDHAARVGRARLVGQSEIERAPRQRRVAGARQEAVELLLDQRLRSARASARSASQVAASALWATTPRIVLRSGPRVADGIVGARVAALGLGDDRRVAEPPRVPIRRRAGSRHSPPRRPRLPADPREHRRQLRVGMRAPAPDARDRRVHAVDPAEMRRDRAPELRSASAGAARGQVERRRRSAAGRRGPAPSCRRAARSGRSGAAGEAVAQRRELRRRVERPVIAALAGIDDHRAAARHGQRWPCRPRRARAPAPAPPARAITGTRQRSGCLVGLVAAELALGQGSVVAAAGAGRARDPDQRHAGLQREIVRDRGDRLAGGAPRSSRHRSSVTVLP